MTSHLFTVSRMVGAAIGIGMLVVVFRARSSPAISVVARRPARLAAGLGVVILALSAAGAAHIAGAGIGAFNLDGEDDVPALFSGALLFATGAVALRLADSSSSTQAARWRTLAAFFVFMGFDELAQFHEGWEGLLDTDWQALYLPVAAVGGLASLAVLRREWPILGARLMLLGGAGVWLSAQLFEKLQRVAVPGGTKLADRWLTLPEESLEMLGSSLFLLACLAVVHARDVSHTANVTPVERAPNALWRGRERASRSLSTTAPSS